MNYTHKRCNLTQLKTQQKTLLPRSRGASLLISLKKGHKTVILTKKMSGPLNPSTLDSEVGESLEFQANQNFTGKTYLRKQNSK